MERIVDDSTPTMKAIIPGKKVIKFSGVKALWASLNVLDLEAIAIHNPLTKSEKEIMIRIATKIVGRL